MITRPCGIAPALKLPSVLVANKMHISQHDQLLLISIVIKAKNESEEILAMSTGPLGLTTLQKSWNGGIFAFNLPLRLSRERG